MSNEKISWVLGSQSRYGVCVCVCVFDLFYDPILGNRYGPGDSSRTSQESTHPRFRISCVPPHPVLTQITWGGQILTLHLNYVFFCFCFLLLCRHTASVPITSGTHSGGVQ